MTMSDMFTDDVQEAYNKFTVVNFVFTDITRYVRATNGFGTNIEACGMKSDDMWIVGILYPSNRLYKFHHGVSHHLSYYMEKFELHHGGDAMGVALATAIITESESVIADKEYPVLESWK
jgi:hypothetical protein